MLLLHTKCLREVTEQEIVDKKLNFRLHPSIVPVGPI